MPQAITALKELQSFLLTEGSKDRQSIFSQYGDTSVGLYIGDKVVPSSVANVVIEALVKRLRESGMPRRLGVQLCGDGRNSDYTSGIMIDTKPGPASLINAQVAVSGWSNATCIDGFQHSSNFGSFLIETIKGDTAVSRPSNSTSPKLAKRAECKTIQVKSGDGCGDLAQRCGIKAADFTKYNSQTKNLCSTLIDGQHVCCSSGDLPDFRPKPKPDGSCATYTVESGDFCNKIAAANSLKVEDIESFNKNTWGWSGCKLLFDKAVICLSKGDPPMPNPIANAECGPQKPGTKKPENGKDLADLNPCPLNACCNIWGQCGVTADFCKNTTLGAPGTAKPGTNGCISNCGTDIVNNKSPPSSFIIDISHVSYQFNKFKKLKGPKRILAFGGWVDSTHPTKYHILRNAVKMENRLQVAKNIAAFVKKHDLDGVDIDWEYPGAPDIPDIPKADEEDGKNYLGLLTLLKGQLGGLSLSIAAPASFWYLKPYPINNIAKVVDYIIYMTYDLHGQWDYDNKWASPGCPKGNCLRSHVNLTETMGALAMITKAGVPSTKVIVGVTSYGRSFKMAKKGCVGPIDSDILVYNDTEWVAYMSDSTKKRRISKYQGLNFGGVTDWAVDLQKFGKLEDSNLIEIIDKDGKCKWKTKDGFSCLDKAVIESDMNPQDRWNGVRAPCAWRDMASSWVDKRSSQNINVTGKENANKFSRHVSDLADGYEKFDCASFSVGVNGCEQEDKCEDTRDSGPAGYFILNSFTSIHTTFKSLWQTVDKVENGMQSKLDQLVETFAPDVDESSEFNLIADFLGIAVGMFAAPFFNKIMKTKDSPTADIKDLIANTASWGATLAKDIQNSKRETPKSKVAGKLSEISDLWTESIEAFTEKAFRGDDESVDYIGDLIADGKFNNDEVTFDMSDLRKQLRKVFFAVLIPEAWKVGAGYAPAFVMDSGYDCNAVGPLDYEYIAPSTGEEMGYCYQGRRYYLLAPNGRERNCDPQVPGGTGGNPTDCKPNYFTAPQGIENLGPKNQDTYDWGGIKAQDLVAGAVEGWKANKEKNGGGFLDLTKTSNYDFLLDGNSDEVNIRLPGFIQIPYGGHNGNWNSTAHGGSKPSPNGGSNSGSKCGSSGGSQTSSYGGSSSGSSFGSNRGPNGSNGSGSKNTQPSIVPVISGAAEQIWQNTLTPFQSTHQFQTLESTFRFRQADGQELDCGRAKITPDLGDSISAVLTFVPLAILIVVTLSSWRVNQSSLTYAHGLNASSLWSVVLDVTSYLRYLQFAFIAALMSIEYPGFFVPAVSKLSWASLLYWSGPFSNGYMYEGPTGAGHFLVQVLDDQAGEAIDRDSSSHTTGGDSNLVPSIHMDSLDTHSTADLLEYRQAPSRETSTRDFQPDPSTFYRPPRSGATSSAYHAPRPAAVLTNPRSPSTDNSSPSIGHFSIDLALSEVAFQPGIDYSFRESDRFYGIDEERVFVSSTSIPNVDTNPGPSSGMRHDETDRSQLKNKLMAGLTNAFTKPRPKAHEKGFQVKRPPRPP
ncbi:Killer toxin subunits alpha/beta [Fusarium odoratissimum]|uniref:chitinase n=1 Tax=Fusarium oxysporum f. sp. cubense (strain race 4) TaxID=2502994 RepID=N1R7N1_FUSC4|nr:Killer toxin subunits alpha/beta [Fusarium odoratissimum]